MHIKHKKSPNCKERRFNYLPNNTTSKYSIHTPIKSI
nr:MAG TPA: hypothetical protein [Caudoviricetes sp.]